MEKKASKLTDITLVAAAVVVAIAIVVLANVGTVAMFRSSSFKADRAQVALFAVSANAVTTEALEIDCNSGLNEASYRFAVSNQKNDKVSEVAIKYTVKVVLPEALPEGLTMAIDGVEGEVDSTGEAYTFTAADWLFDAAEAGAKVHTLTFVADPDVLDCNVEMDKVRVSVTMEQIN